MASKTNVEGRKDVKLAAKIKHYDGLGHTVEHVMYGTKGKFVWLCHLCGPTKKVRHE